MGSGLSRWGDPGLGTQKPPTTAGAATANPSGPPQAGTQALREQYPRWGRESARGGLEREGVYLSAKSIDQVIACLKARGVLREPLRPRKSAALQSAQGGQRRPPDLVVDRPGALVQIDSKQVSLGGDKVVFHFGAVDYFTHKRVVGLAPRLTSPQEAAFLRRVVERFPFPVAAIQSDGGGEFLGAVELAVQELKLLHYFNRPNYPQGNGRVERSFRTDESA